ncbi:hypothetical protein LD39_08800 [Halobacillus sp. BBL2006]|nr:hypothetical protein LD39_08800 [Halobacillus sp. BBL2006]
MSMSPGVAVFKGTIFIENGKVAKVIPQPYEDSSLQAEEIVDGEGMIVMPGMTNAHYHSYSNLLKGTENALPLELWSLYTVAYGHSLTEEDIELAVLLGAAEMIRSGVTGCIDHFPHLPKVEAALKAYEQSKMHVSVAPMLHDIPDHRFLQLDLPPHLMEKLEGSQPKTMEEMKEFYIHLAHDWHEKNGRIRIMAGPNAPQRCSTEALKLCKELSERFDLQVHTHLLETKIQESYSKKFYNNGLVYELDQLGLLNNRLSVAHGVWLHPDEIDLLKDRGVSVIYNPASNMMLGSGLAPIPDYLEKGVPLALGTDASNCGTAHNLFETMRLGAMIHRSSQPDFETWPTPYQMLEMACINGAKIMGGSSRGRIESGYDADLVFLNKTTTTWATDHNIPSQLVFHETGQSVDSVMIEGEWVMRNKQILSFDEDYVIRRAQHRSQEIAENSASSLALADELKPHVKAFYNQFYQ